MKLEGKVVFVTGAGGGMGRAACAKFAEEGARVAVADINYTDALGTAKDIENKGGVAIVLEVNVTDEASVRNAIDICIEKLGGLDILANFAGITQNKKFEAMTVEEWDRVISVNLKGTFLPSNIAFQYMMGHNGGSIINVSSAAVYSGGGHIGTAHYTASKSGVIGLTKAIAKEGAKYGIRCNAICPGLTATNMTAVFLKESEEISVKGIPMGRVGTPGDIADAAIFLASEQSAYITGTTLDVNGGLAMR